MKKHILGALCALPAVAAQTAVAADDTTADTLAPIVVSDNRSREITSPTPASIRIIDRTEIDASGAQNLADLLAGRAGIFVSDIFGDGSNASLDMRGFGNAANNNVLVTVDGRRLNPSSDNATLYLNSIDLDRVAQVEIVQGSAAILYGNMAVGGLINIITRKPGAPEHRVAVGGGSYDGHEAKFDASERLASGWGYRVNARLRDTDNYRARNAARLRNLSLLVDRQLDGGRAFVELERFDEYLQTPGALFAPELAADRRQAVYAGDYIDTRAQQARIGLHQDLSAAWRFEGELGYRNDKRAFVQSFRAFPGSRATQDREILTANPRLIGRLGSSVLTLGADWERTDYQLLTSFGPQTVDQDIRAVYGQLVQPLGERTDLTVGVRHARIDNDIYNGITTAALNDDVTVGSAGLSFRPYRHWRLFARAEQNYRFAKVDEHTNIVFGQPIGLKNPKGISYEAGAQYAHAGTQASITVYRLDIEDEIGFDASGFYNINLDRTRRTGLQLALARPLSASLLAGLDLDVTNGRLTSGPYDGKRIPNVPRHQERAHVEWAANSATSLYLEALHVGDRVLGADFANLYPKLDSYTVLNFKLGYEHGPWQLGARINNLLDEHYIATGALGYDATFTKQPGYNPAPERNLWLSASYQF
jgi:iron complex outermembrane receptor protein